jgi:hypothetical protein
MKAPLVSVIWNARGQTAALQKNIAALREQSHENYELLVVEDVNSTEESKAILRAAAAADARVRVVPRQAAGSGESLLLALRECRGDFIAICPSEGRFVPDALQFAVEAFRRHPGAGIVCGESFLIDVAGKTLDNVDIVTLLLTSYRPFLPAGFFRRRALLDSGLQTDDWLCETIELELCTRMACDFAVLHFPRKVVDCPSPWTQDDGLPKAALRSLDERLRLISRVFSAEGFWGADEALCLESKVNHIGLLWQQFGTHGPDDVDHRAQTQLAEIAGQFDALLLKDHRVLRNLHRLFCTRSHALGFMSTPLQKLLSFSSRRKDRLAIHIPYQMWAFLLGVGSWIKQKVITLSPPRSDHHPAAPTRGQMFADLYAIAASRYEARGQVDNALAMWELAQPLGSVDIDSLAAQAVLRLPAATNETIAAFQRKWASRHVGARGRIALKTANVPAITRRIRVGYHCAFMYGDTIRYMMKNVLRAHDRERFEIYGYAPTPVPTDIANVFDVLRDTGAKRAESTPEPMSGVPAIPNEDFVAMVRHDEIDILVELTGFSMGHRFVAMAERCAPVQISYLNHTGPSEIPNVDYILADDIGTTDADQAYYSERIYRLPSCFFCFDYRGADDPPVLLEPPSASTRRTTFGCFGYGGKLNHELIEIWARLLHRVPGSALHLQNLQLQSHDFRRFISAQFANLGIDHDRLVLVEGVGRSALLKVYSQIDISLDTWPYCGGNTIAESLWMGVPVVTLLGDRFSSRYGASLLAAAGCSDLVGKTPEEYIDIAAKLAADLPRLRTLRRDLRQMSVENGLADSQRFARDLENAYVEMLGQVAVDPN